MKLKKACFLAISLCAIAGIVYMANEIDIELMSFAAVKRYALFMQLFKEEHYLQAVAIYLGLFVMLSACFIPVTVVMTFLGGYLFGAWWGGIYATLGATLGGAVVFMLVRYFFRARVRKMYSKRFSRFNREFKHSAYYLLCLQVSPVTPTFFINLFSGLTSVSLWTFMWTAALGMLPGSLVYAYAGEQLHYIKQPDTVMSTRMFFLLLAMSCIIMVPVLVGRIRKK